jgi:uncharacterized RDD family membrane protein YckC
MSAPPRERPDVLDRRIGAGLIDILVVLVLAVVFTVLWGDTNSGDGKVSVKLEGVPALAFFATALLYYGVLEALTGQTLGKRILGIRVVRAADGSRASAGQVVARTLLRIIDGILFYLVGLIAVLATGSKRQRLGDMAAGTTVTRA